MATFLHGFFCCGCCVFALAYAYLGEAFPASVFVLCAVYNAALGWAHATLDAGDRKAVRR
jgi:hypothetical protein